jgi:hypothetical protein
MVLDLGISPVTFSVGNTMKRVAVVISAVMFFKVVRAACFRLDEIHDGHFDTRCLLLLITASLAIEILLLYVLNMNALVPLALPLLETEPC